MGAFLSGPVGLGRAAQTVVEITQSGVLVLADPRDRRGRLAAATVRSADGD
jgi:hypothetical protein